MSRFSPFLHCCSSSVSTHLMDSGGHLKQAHWDICLSVPVSFWTWKRVLLMGTDMSCLNDQVSIALVSTYTARPLATAHEKTQTEGFTTIQYFILGKGWENSMQFSPQSCFGFTFFNRNGGLPNRMLSVYLGTAIHKPSSCLLVIGELFIGHCPSDYTIWQLLVQFQSQS